MKKEFTDKWQFFKRKIAYPYQYFNSIDDYQKRVDILNKEDFFSKLKNKCPNDEQTEQTKETINMFDIKNAEEKTNLFCKSDVALSADVIEKFVKVSLKNMVLILYTVCVYLVIPIDKL